VRGGFALDEKAFEGLEDGLRRFLRQIVAVIERTASHVARGFAPDRKLVAVVEFSGVAAASPHDKRRCRNLAPGAVILLVMREVDSCSGTMVTRHLSVG
jgi:hypothetical protein